MENAPALQQIHKSSTHALPRGIQTGWPSRVAKVTMGFLVLELVTGLAVTFGPFNATIQWGVLVHTFTGLAMLLPVCWYCAVHCSDYRDRAFSDVVLLGYLTVAALLVCSVSGVVVTAQALFGIRTTRVWRNIHLVSTFVIAGSVFAHLTLVRSARQGIETVHLQTVDAKTFSTYRRLLCFSKIAF